MGLHVQVGLFADLEGHDPDSLHSHSEQLGFINECLRRNGLAPHQEPENIPVSSWDTGGYWPLHCLRRLGAWLNLEGQLPTPGDESSDEDEVLARYYDFERGTQGGLPRHTFDHLIFHSDAEGYYVPIDFPEVLFPDDDLDVDGGMFGSVQQLASECDLLAKVLAIPEGIGPASPALVAAARGQGRGDLRWQRYGVESRACLILREAARIALEQRAAIVFC